MSDAAASIIAIPVSILAALLLFGIGLAVTRVQQPQLVRRHSGSDTYWSIQPEQIDHSEGVLTAEHRPRHSRVLDTVYDAIEGQDACIVDGTIETWESFGRRGLDSPVRHQKVDDDWMPPLGNIRIALLRTPTAEYLFARKPKDQLQPRLVRGYMVSDLVQSW